MAHVAYQLAGPGKKPAVAWFDAELISDPAVWLIERLGQLAWVRVAGREPAAREAPAPGIEAASEVPGGYGDRPAAFPVWSRTTRL